MSRFTLSQIENRNAAGIGIYQRNGQFIVQMFSSQKGGFGSWAEAHAWANSRGFYFE